MIRVDQQDGVEQIRFVIGKFPVRAQHVENILCDGILAARIVDDQRAPVKGMHLCVICVTSQGGEFRDQIDPFEEILVYISLVGRRIVVVEGQNRRLQLVHEVARRLEQKLVAEKALGQLIPHGETSLEILKLFLVRQITEQQKETGFLKTEIFLPVLDQILDGIAAEEQIALAGDDISLFIIGIAHDI